MGLDGSMRAYERANRTMGRAYDACSELLQRTDLPDEDRARIRAFRSWVTGHSITQFAEDTSNRVAREVRDRAIPILAEYGIDEPAVTWG